MSTPRKLPAGKGKAVGAEVVGLAVDKARTALNDPRTRQMLMEQAKTIAFQAQQWKKDNAPASHTRPKLASRSARQGWSAASRTCAPRSPHSLTVAPELGAALKPVGEAVDRLAVSVGIAGRMPALKRKSAHMRIDQELDQLEADLFDQTFPLGEDEA